LPFAAIPVRIHRYPTATHVHVLSHGDVSLPELVGADTRRHALGIDDGRQRSGEKSDSSPTRTECDPEPVATAGRHHPGHAGCRPSWGTSYCGCRCDLPPCYGNQIVAACTQSGSASVCHVNRRPGLPPRHPARAYTSTFAPRRTRSKLRIQSRSPPNRPPGRRARPVGAPRLHPCDSRAETGRPLCALTATSS